MLSFEIKKWFIHTREGRKGPYSLIDLRNDLGSGRIVDTTVVSSDTVSPVPLKDLAEFKPFLNMAAWVSENQENEKTVIARKTDEGDATLVMSPAQKEAISSKQKKKRSQTNATVPKPEPEPKKRSEPEVIQSLELDSGPVEKPAAAPAPQPVKPAIAVTPPPTPTVTPPPTPTAAPAASPSWKDKYKYERPSRAEPEPNEAPPPKAEPVARPEWFTTVTNRTEPPPELVTESDEDPPTERENSNPTEFSEGDESDEPVELDRVHPSLGGGSDENSETSANFSLSETNPFVRQGKSGYSRPRRKMGKIPPNLILGAIGLAFFGGLIAIFMIFSDPRYGKSKYYGMKAQANESSLELAMDHTSPEEYKQLDAIVGSAVPRLAVAESNAQSTEATFYVASSLPTGSNLQLSVENPKNTPSLMWLGFFTQPITKIFEIKTDLKNPLPAGSYVYVFDDSDQPERTHQVLLGFEANRRVPSIPQFKKLVARQKCLTP